MMKRFCGSIFVVGILLVSGLIFAYSYDKSVNCSKPA